MSERLHERPCPRCGEVTHSTLACEACRSPLQEPEGSHHFARLGVSPLQALDPEALERRLIALSRLLHPDHQPAGDVDAQLLAVSHSALLNEAYTTLCDEQSRHEYLLELFHPGSLEKYKTLDPLFLMEAMEVNEELEQAREDGCSETVTRIAEMAREAIAERMQGITVVCRDTMQRIANADSEDSPDVGGVPRPLAAHWDTEEIATLLHQARVYRRILRDTQGAAPGSH